VPSRRILNMSTNDKMDSETVVSAIRVTPDNLCIEGFSVTMSETRKPKTMNGGAGDYNSKGYSTRYDMKFKVPVPLTLQNLSDTHRYVELMQVAAIKANRNTQEVDGIIPGPADDIHNIVDPTKFPHVSTDRVVKAGAEGAWLKTRVEQLCGTVVNTPATPTATAPAVAPKKKPVAKKTADTQAEAFEEAAAAVPATNTNATTTLEVV